MISKLISVAAFACAALAYNITISQPAPGTKVDAAAPFDIVIQRPTPPSDFHDVAIVIGASACMLGPCSNDGAGQFLLADGPFNPKSDGSGTESQSFTVDPRSSGFGGTTQINVVHMYLDGSNNNVAQETVTTTVEFVGSG